LKVSEEELSPVMSATLDERNPSAADVLRKKLASGSIPRISSVTKSGLPIS
jgi:hypothetical protein